MAAVLAGPALAPDVSAQAGDTRMRPVIRHVDHILIESTEPVALFRFFAGTLQLPVAWLNLRGFLSVSTILSIA